MKSHFWAGEVLRSIVVILTVTGLPACRPSVSAGDDGTSASAALSGGSASASNLKRVRILPAGTGSASPVGALSLQVGQSVSLRAALFSFSGAYLQDIDVLWTFSNATFPTSNLSAGATGSPTTTFAPTAIGTTLIQATYVGNDPDVASPTASTGGVTVSSNQVLASLTIAAGDGQSAVVNNNLSTDLKVRMLDTFGLPVAGASVNWSATQGGGSIVSPSTSVTDSNGYAVATVKVGTVAGSNNQRFHAVSAANGSLSADFQASALPGSAAGVVFATQPAGAIATVPFITQPVVRVVDSYGNVATSAVGNVTLARQAGTGALGGTVVATLSSGVASYSNVSYSIQENGVVVRASYNSFTADSSAFNVAARPPGACQTNDTHFTTAAGGCQDLTSGLAWSAPSAARMSWFQAVWNSARPGGSPPEASDQGRTNDLTGGSSHCGSDPTYCDNDPAAYCHSLTEGGMNDWRIPSALDWQTVYADTASGTGPYLAGVQNDVYWTGDTYWNDVTAALRFNPITGVIAADGKWFAATFTYCVRGGPARVPADHLVVTSAPPSAAAGRSGYTVAVQLKDPQGNSVSTEGVSVTLSSTSLGALGGTTSATTDFWGRATFSAWTLSTVGQATVTVTAPGYASTTFTVPVGAFPHTCKLEDSRFITAQGGCKDLTTGLVWSLPAPMKMNWHDAIWGSTSSPLFNVQPDADDGARTNEYENSPTTVPDGSTTNYCHDLAEGGYTDWRLPKSYEIGNLYSLGNGAPTHFAYDVNRWFWSALTWGGDPNYVIAYNVGTGASQTQVKWWQYDVMCVRP